MVRTKPVSVILITFLICLSCISFCQATAKAEWPNGLVLESYSPHKVHTDMEVWLHFSFKSDQMIDTSFNIIGWLNAPNTAGVYVLADGYWAPSHPDGSGPYWFNVSAQNSFDVNDAEPMIVRVESMINGQMVYSQNATVEVEQAQPPLNASASCDHWSGQTPVEVQFHSNATDGYPPYTYFWDFGDGNGSTLADPSHLYTQAIYQNPVLTVADRYVKRTIAVQLIVFDPLNVKISAQKTTLRPSEVQFSSTITGGYGQYNSYREFGWYGAYHFEWDFGDGYGSDLPNPKHTYAQSGHYQVTLKTYNSNLTTDFQTLNVNVDSADMIPYEAILLAIAVLSIGVGLGFYYVRWRAKKHPPGG